jgi:hypothetical protein
MDSAINIEAWNNFVLRSQPSDYHVGTIERAAAIANLYMGVANNGGINSFLTFNNDLDATEVSEALILVGAMEAAKQFNHVLQGLKVPIPASSQDARWKLLERHWTTSLDAHDVLSADANEDLLRALRLHVEANNEFYLTLKPSRESSR